MFLTAAQWDFSIQIDTSPSLYGSKFPSNLLSCLPAFAVLLMLAQQVGVAHQCPDCSAGHNCLPWCWSSGSGGTPFTSDHTPTCVSIHSSVQGEPPLLVNRAPFSAFGGWSLGVNAFAPPTYQQVGYELASFLCSPNTSWSLVLSEASRECCWPNWQLSEMRGLAGGQECGGRSLTCRTTSATDVEARMPARAVELSECRGWLD